MAILKTIATGSSGNAYILECANETLLIELGVSWNDILKVLNFNIENVVGACVSHAHRPRPLVIN